MPVMSYEETRQFLEARLGLRQVDTDVWLGFQRIGVQVFPIYVRLDEVFVGVRIPQNLLTPCNQPALHQYLSQANSKVVIGNLGVGPDQAGQGEGRPLLLHSEFPAGTRQEYTSQEELAMLFHFAFQLVEQHHRHLQELVQRGCEPLPGPGPGIVERLAERLRAFRD
jgi:hypothetical protein